jgi:hypothetical protein
MAQEKRIADSVEAAKGSMPPGPLLARVISHLDPTFMGALEVTLLREQGNGMGVDEETYIVKCASPFFGHTAFEHTGQNSIIKNKNTKTYDAYNDTQKSYGMWMVPPDIGVTVMVVFIEGDPADGYWIACIPSKLANNMVPGIAASLELDIDETDKKKFNTTQPLPTAEINKRINGEEGKLDTDKIKKAVHPFADHLLEQGLLEDDIRGFTTASARREAPSMVFGISSPGPLDRRTGSKRQNIGTRDSQTPKPVPVSRLGGTQFVMDDGDDRYFRKTPPKGPNAGPQEYVDTEDPKLKDPYQPDIPYSEYFRIRTRTGHQLLMHNSEDLIYIANAAGSTWIELTAGGKIDIYAADSISIHSEADFNFRADRDINFEAGRNMNFRTESGRWQAEIATDMNFLIANDAKLSVGSNLDILVNATTKISQRNDFHLDTNGNNNISAGGNTSIGSVGNHIESADKIYMNSIAATPATPADFVKPLDLKENVATTTQVGWSKKKYQAGTIDSFMKRIPMHEPWALHENYAPQLLTPDKTDREV